jgi:hypothetical protein
MVSGPSISHVTLVFEFVVFLKIALPLYHDQSAVGQMHPLNNFE